MKPNPEEEKRAAVRQFMELDATADDQNIYAKQLRGIFSDESAIPKKQPDYPQIYAQILAQSAKAGREIKVSVSRWRKWSIAIAACACISFISIFVFSQISRNPELVLLKESRTQMTRFDNISGIKSFFRAATGLRISQKGKEVQFNAAQITGVFDYSRNDTVQTLIVATPLARFSVTGTKFIIDADDKHAHLLVREGKVRVDTNGMSLAIESGQGLLVNATTPTPETYAFEAPGIFETFETAVKLPVDISKKILKERKSMPAQKQSTVVLHLKNGTTIRGFEVKNDPDAVEISVPALNNTIMRIRKEDIVGNE